MEEHHPRPENWRARAMLLHSNTRTTHRPHFAWFACLVLLAGLASPGLRASNIGKAWQQTSPLPTERSLYGMAWTGSQLLAVGDDTALASADGVSWKPSRLRGDAFNSLAWSGHLLVAGVSEPGCVATSSDGVNWTLSHTSYEGSIRAVTWCQDRFVAMGYNEYGRDSVSHSSLLTSSDGLAWTVQPMAGLPWDSYNDSWMTAAIWTGTNYVAVGSDWLSLLNYRIPLIFTSPDGVTWTRSTVDPSLRGMLEALTWTGTQVVAVGAAGICTSPTGTGAWTTRAGVAGLNSVPTVIWGGGKLLASGSGIIETSPDGITWTEVATTGWATNALVYTGTQYVAAGNWGATFTSTDGVTWTQRTSGNSFTFDYRCAALWGPAQGGTGWVSVGRNGNGYVETSPDGSTWNLETLPAGVGGLKSITQDGLVMVAAGTGGTLIHSTDGTTWTKASLTGGANLYGVAANNSLNPPLAVAVGTTSSWTSGVIYTSTDTDHWTAAIVPSGVTLLSGVTYTGTQWVSVGRNGVILTSPDGSVWTRRASGTTNSLFGVAASGSLVVAVGDNGTILSSPDGLVWTNRSPPDLTSACNSILWTGTNFMAVAGTTALLSDDGMHWTPYETGAEQPLHGIAWNGQQALAVGDMGVVVLSDALPSVSTFASAIAALESEGTVQFTVKLSFAADGASVPFTLGGSAIAGTDYTAPASPLVFANGETSKNITLVLNPGAQHQQTSPTVIVTLGTPTGAHLGSPDSTTLTLQDTNGPPPVTFGRAALTASVDDGTVAVAVQLGWAPTSPVSVQINVADSAAVRTDYTALSGTLEFQAGEQFKELLIPLTADARVAGPETLTFTFGSLTNATPGAITQFVLAIQNNQAAGGSAQWTTRNPLPGGEGLNCVAWSPSLALLVVMGGGGSALTSPDGIHWTRRLTGSTSPHSSVAWGGQQFVAVGGDASLLTSSDGIAWVQRQFAANIGPDQAGVSKVVCVHGLFIALGSSLVSHVPLAFTSADGSHWTQRDLGRNEGTPLSATWTGSQFVIVGDGDSHGAFPLVLTSSDGIIWSDQSSTAPAGARFVDVTWTGSQLVALTGGTTAYASPNALSWTKCSAGTLGPVGAEVWSGSKLVAVGLAISTSSTGTVWTQKASGVAPINLAGVASTGTRFVAVGGSSTILTSADGVTWSKCSTGTDTNLAGLNGVVWSGTQYVAVGDGGLILTSPDNTTWTRRTSHSTHDLARIAWSGTVFVATGAAGTVLTSTDGIAWTARASGTTLDLHAVIWAGRQFVAVGGKDSNFDASNMFVEGSGIVLTSPNGIAWTMHYMPALVSLNGIAYSSLSSTFFAVGGEGALLKSQDAINWFDVGISHYDNIRLNDVVCTGNGSFVAVGNDGQILRFIEGPYPVTATRSVAVPPGTTLKSVCWTGSALVATAGGGAIFTSPYASMQAVQQAGATDIWTAEPSHTNNDLNGQAWTGSTLLAVGANGIIISSGAGAPPVPVVTFTASSISFTEGEGTLHIGADLSSPPTHQVIVPVTFTAPAQTPIRLGAAGDLMLPGTTLVFNPGQTHLDWPAMIINNNKVDGDRTATLTLVGPVTGATLGSPPPSLGLILTDNDQALTINSQPQPGWYWVGDPASLSVAANGSGALTYQWQKAGVNIAGATGPQLQIDSLKLSDGGAYRVVVKNNVGSLVSSTAEIVVVDPAPPPVVVARGATATLSAPAVGATAGGLHYQWFKGTTQTADSSPHITGSTARSLLIKASVVEDAGDYHCTVTSTSQSGSLDTGTCTLSVTTGKPQFAPSGGNQVPDPLPVGAVAVPYSGYTVTVEVDAASRFAASGLPAGMSIDPIWGILRGTPTAAVTGQKVVITASNASGSNSVTTHLTINPLPDGIAGTYDGFVDRDALFDSLQGSRFQATLTASGSYTGKVIVGTISHAFSGVLTNDGSQYVSFTPLVRPGKPATSLYLICDPASNQLFVNMFSPGTSVPNGGYSGQAWRKVWSATHLAANLPGYYTFGIYPPFSSGDVTIPQGTGYGSCTVPANGAVFTISGRLADGNAFATTTFLGPHGEVLLYQPLYTGRGGLLGYVIVRPGNVTPFVNGTVSATSASVYSTLDWSKPTSSLASERTYNAGFHPSPLTVIGARYLYTPGSLVMGLTAGSGNNATLSFTEQEFTNNKDAPILDVQVLASGKTGPFAPGSNPNNITLAITPATGAFTGGFKLVEPDPANTSVIITRPVTFQGVIVTRSTSLASGVGWFLLPTLPSLSTGDIPASQTPVRSGQVQLLKK